MANDDVRSMRDRPYLYAYDLPEGRDAVVTIRDVQQRELQNAKGKEKKPALLIEGTDKALVLNATNLKTIGTLLGSFKRSEWIGKRIALYATTTDVGGQTVGCIRVRPKLPEAKAKGEQIGDGPANDAEIAKKAEAARAAG